MRYRGAAPEATVEPLAGNRFRVQFNEPCRGTAPGQAAVCDAGDRV
jgi:tRNA U34 2-thiouridine synthase MnmA/TrmU